MNIHIEIFVLTPQWLKCFATSADCQMLADMQYDIVPLPTAYTPDYNTATVLTVGEAGKIQWMISPAHIGH